MQIAMIQDKIISLDQLDPSYLDRASFFGDGVYEVIRSYNGKVFALDDHMQRFSNSLNAIGITTVDIGQIRGRVMQAFEAAEIANAKIYFHITRGCAQRKHSFDENMQPNFFLTIHELEDASEVKANGISVSIHPDWRWKRCDIKSLNLLANVLASQDAVKKGCEEAILVDENGLITEGASSAFFAIFDGKLQTAPTTANILPSVTRKYTLQAAKIVGLEVIEESLTPSLAVEADELFIAVTTKDIIGVVKFDGATISDGKPGKYTKLLMEQFRSFIE